MMIEKASAFMHMAGERPSGLKSSIRDTCGRPTHLYASKASKSSGSSGPRKLV